LHGKKRIISASNRQRNERIQIEKKRVEEDNAMKRRVILKAAAVSFLILFIIFAFFSKYETAEASDLNILGIEIGTCFVYNVDAGEIGPAQLFSINLPVGTNIVGGFTLIDGDNVTALDYNLLRFSYLSVRRSLWVWTCMQVEVG